MQKLNAKLKIFKKTILALFVTSFCILNFAFYVCDAQVMSSSHYAIQDESVNFGGGDSSSGNYGLQDTAGEVASGYSASAGYGVNAGYQQTFSTSTSATTSPSNPTPPTTLPASSGSSMSGSTLPLPNPTLFSATPMTSTASTQSGIDLSWINPTDARFLQVRVVRSSNFFPSNELDGTLVYEGPAEKFFDAQVTPGATYYYAIFAEGINGLVSSGALSFATLSIPGVIATTTPVSQINPFVSVPPAAHVDPMIASLTLADFEFIQNDQFLQIASGNNISIDGSANLTIRLPYDRVPQILKTIALGISDPSDLSKAFIFLLRPNVDKTYYEATIGPLGFSGTYSLAISVLDYQNQGLKQLAGALDAYKTATKAIGPSTGMWIWIGVILAALIILCIIMGIIFKNRRGRKSPNDPNDNDNNLRSKIQPKIVIQPKKVVEPELALSALHAQANMGKTILSILALLVVSAVAFGTFTRPVVAAFNQEINYQGKLMDVSGNPVSDGSYNVEFKLYTSPSGGSPIWTEDDLVTNGQGASLKSGLFSLMLGATNPLTGVDFDQTLYLGVNIGGMGASTVWDGEMTPRKVLGAVPAAFVAQAAQTAVTAQTAATATNAINAENAATATDALNSQALNGLNSSEFIRADAQNATSSSSTFLNVIQNGAGKIAEFFGSAAQSVLSILSNGNVGIGTSSPSNALEVAGNGYFSGNLTTGNVMATGTLAAASASITGTTTTAGLSVGSLGGLLFGSNGAVNALANGANGYVLQATAFGEQWVATSTLGFGGSSGTVSSVDASGGTTGLTFSGGPITSAGTLTLGGTLGVGNGGTGSSSWATNYVLLGNGTGAFQQVATSSLGLLTTNVAEGSNLYFTTSRASTTAIAVLGATTSLPNITTLTGLSSIGSSGATSTFAGLVMIGTKTSINNNGDVVLGTNHIANRPVDSSGGSQLTVITGASVGGSGDAIMAGNNLDGGVEMDIGAVGNEVGFTTINDEFLAVKDSWPSGGYTYGNGALHIGYGTGGGDGNVGIGTTNPNTKLEVVGTASSPGLITFHRRYMTQASWRE